MIWLVDYTHYFIKIDPRLAKCKREYFKIKSFKRHFKIGETAPVKTRMFSTGLLRLASILSSNGIETEYLDYITLEKRINEKADFPEIVAFSAVCPTMSDCERLAMRIKAISPMTTTVVGGVHVNLNPNTTKKMFPGFDRVNLGYEYEAAENLVGRKLIHKTEKYVDYSLLPLNLSEYGINTFTHMGCAFNCEYCSDGLSPKFISSKDGQISDMKLLLPPKTLVHFFDSCFGYSKAGIHECCEAIKKTNHDFLLSCDMRADLLTPELIDDLVSCGFVEIRLGMESSDQSILNRNKRTLSSNAFDEKIKMIRECSDLYVTLYSVTGLPGTTTDSQKNTVSYCQKLLSEHIVDEIKCGLYVPYPIEGIDYQNRGIRILSDDLSKYDRQSMPVFETDLMSASDLFELYIYTSQKINEAWLSSCGFASYDEIPNFPDYYQEYIFNSYLEKE